MLKYYKSTSGAMGSDQKCYIKGSFTFSLGLINLFGSPIAHNYGHGFSLSLFKPRVQHLDLIPFFLSIFLFPLPPNIMSLFSADLQAQLFQRNCPVISIKPILPIQWNCCPHTFVQTGAFYHFYGSAMNHLEFGIWVRVNTNFNTSTLSKRPSL